MNGWDYGKIVWEKNSGSKQLLNITALMTRLDRTI